jgi:hypothetical protein
MMFRLTLGNVNEPWNLLGGLTWASCRLELSQ